MDGIVVVAYQRHVFIRRIVCNVRIRTVVQRDEDVQQDYAGPSSVFYAGRSQGRMG